MVSFRLGARFLGAYLLAAGMVLAFNACAGAEEHAEEAATHTEHGEHQKEPHGHNGHVHDGHGQGAVEDLTHGNASPQMAAPEEFKSDLAIYTFVVFLLLLAILWKFAWGPICEGLQRREQAIADNIATAENAADEARKLTSEYEAKLAGAADEVRKVMDDARRDAEFTSQQIVEKAQAKAAEEGNRMLREVEMAKDAALKEISDGAADLAVDLAGQIVGRELSAGDHNRLIEEAQSEFLSARPNAS